ncbi:L-2-hydroxyglutarate oxidase [Smaragdicoccus niigatensis]|uniref:L-2-hydroxyglutarate oxidase n=1 Tax=Smaragdicoccus niigatensis TaxID=359359 RepID=UPI00037EC0BB|nr:L-2-hydroxyglutarate oxidase [Smaragdicoccus niigatensis]
MSYDFCVIGGGIVGLAVAHRLLSERPGASLVVLEKENALAVHQTGHNSGVIHSGIYYEPGSMKARFCREGAAATKEFAKEHGIALDVRGKLLVATDEAEYARMLRLDERARVNGIRAELIDAAELRKREPNVRGTGALFIPDTGIVDYPAITRKLGELVQAAGGEIVLGTAVTAIREASDGVEIRAGDRVWTARHLVVCGGLQADRLAKLAGVDPGCQIVPFRGEYYQLPTARSGLVHHLIYPIPDPALPFLGVHLNPTIDGSLTVGPNAVLGLAREGYRKWSFNRRDFGEMARFRGNYRMGRQHVRTGVRELRNSAFKRGYLAECRKYCPSLELSDLQPRPAGIRAQAVLKDGTLVHDFMLVRTVRMLHVLNAPSPAATSALPISRHVVAELLG